MTFAPDALAPAGGYPGTEDKAREMFGTLDQAKTRADMLAAANYLKSRPDCTGRIGVVGFCWGGAPRTTWQPACRTLPPRFRSTAEAPRRIAPPR